MSEPQLEYVTKERPPKGRGTVEAFSRPKGRWIKLNWKYVARHFDVYPRWRPTESFYWRREPSATAGQS